MNHKALAKAFNDEVRAATENPDDHRKLYVKTEGHIKDWLKEMEKRKKAKKSLSTIAPDIIRLRVALRDNTDSTLPVPITVMQPRRPTRHNRRRSRNRSRASTAGTGTSRGATETGESERHESDGVTDYERTAAAATGATMQDHRTMPPSPHATDTQNEAAPASPTGGGGRPQAPSESVVPSRPDTSLCSACGGRRYGGRNNTHHMLGWCNVTGQWGVKTRCPACKTTRRNCKCGDSDRRAEEIRAKLSKRRRV